MKYISFFLSFFFLVETISCSGDEAIRFSDIEFRTDSMIIAAIPVGDVDIVATRKEPGNKVDPVFLYIVDSERKVINSFVVRRSSSDVVLAKDDERFAILDEDGIYMFFVKRDLLSKIPLSDVQSLEISKMMIIGDRVYCWGTYRPLYSIDIDSGAITEYNVWVYGYNVVFVKGNYYVLCSDGIGKTKLCVIDDGIVADAEGVEYKLIDSWILAEVGGAAITYDDFIPVITLDFINDDDKLAMYNSLMKQTVE